MSESPTGRPSKFTVAVADEIIERLSNGVPLAVMCREDHLPHRSTVTGWCLTIPEFGERCRMAREIGFEHLAAECLEIADTPLEGIRTPTGKDGVEIIREDMLAHRRLQIDTRLKLLAKWDPKRYGDRVDMKAAGAGEIRIVIGGDLE